jgi:hypothetical protein
MKTKHIILGGLGLFILGCATPHLKNTQNKNVTNVNREIKQVDIENMIISQYQITKNALTKAKNRYVFFMPANEGLGLYVLNSKYQLVYKKVIPQYIEGKKLIYKNGKFYLLGYDQNKEKTVLITLDDKLNVTSEKYIGKKYDIPRDFYVNKKPVILMDAFRKSTDIEIVDGNKTKVFKEKSNELGKFIRPFNGGILVVGTIQHPEEDLLLMFIKNGKLVWSKVYDFGMQDEPVDIKIKGDKAVITVASTDYMGAEDDYTITIDKKGKIIKHQKGIQIKQLPLRFRT